MLILESILYINILITIPNYDDLSYPVVMKKITNPNSHKYSY
jgi:hypothetical protein